jgi:uncharacterized membrane protein
MSDGRNFLGGPGAYAVRSVPPSHIGLWLAAGWRDLMRCPGPGLLHGAAMAGFGLAMVWLARDHFWVLAGAFSGFLLVAPLAATGLYAISRHLEQEGRAGLADAIAIWRTHDGKLMHFGLLLALAGTGWVVTSASLVTSMSEVSIAKPMDFLKLVAHGRGWVFEAWLMLGAALAAPVFASSVVAIPLLLDRRGDPRLDVLRAVLTSWRVVEANPLPMALWALTLVALAMLGMATLLVGMVVVGPWLAHASWHAYRDLVATPGGPHDLNP